MADNEYSQDNSFGTSLGARMLRMRGIMPVMDDDQGAPEADDKTSNGLPPGTKAYDENGNPADAKVSPGANGRLNVAIQPRNASPSTPDASASNTAVNSGATSGAAAGPSLGSRMLKPATAPAAPPPAPALDPGYGAAQESFRKDSVVTPKTDAQGNTLGQYKAGFGTRLLRGVGDYFGGGISGVIKGAVDPNSKGYFGKGAVNGQYSKDETARQNRLSADQAAVKSMDDEYSQREKGYGHELTSYNDEVRADMTGKLRDIQQQREDERKQNDSTISDIKQQLADAKDPIQRMRAEVNAREAIGKEAGLSGEDLKRYKIYGDKSSMDANRQSQLDLREKQLDLQQQKIDLDRQKAESAKSKNSVTFKDSPAIDKFSDQWYQTHRDQVRKDKAQALRNAGGNAANAQDDYKDIEQSYRTQANEFEGRKKGYYDSVKSGKPVTINPGTGAPADNSDIEQPQFDVRTGQPLKAPAQATAPTQAKTSPSTPQYTKFANDGKGNRVGYNPTTKQWEPVRK